MMKQGPDKSKTAKNAPGVTIPKPKVNKHGSAKPDKKVAPEFLPQQLNPIGGKSGQPQYKDETPIKGKNLRAMIAHLRGS